jgi:hypothetical protein
MYCFILLDTVYKIGAGHIVTVAGKDTYILDTGLLETLMGITLVFMALVAIVAVFWILTGFISRMKSFDSGRLVHAVISKNISGTYIAFLENGPHVCRECGSKLMEGCDCCHKCGKERGT